MPSETSPVNSISSNMQHLQPATPQPAASPPQQQATPPQQFCLRWNNYQSNLTNVFDQLLQSESFVDVTLACDGQSVKAHKMVLSACSPYFQALFVDNPCQHPIIIMRDIKWPELRAAVEFMYRGEINVSQEQIGPLLRVAETLKIRGLADVNGEQDGSLDAAERPLLPSPGPLYPRHNSRKRRRTSAGIGSPPSASSASCATPPAGVGNIVGSTANTIIPPSPSAPGAGVPLPVQLPMSLPPPPPPPTPHPDDMEIKPGIAEMIREEERAKLLENSHAWLGASTSSIADYPSLLKLKAPTWTQRQLQEAMQAVVTQRMRFTQASAQYRIPKGTLYDNILGKSNRMRALQVAALTAAEESAVLEFCCDVSVSPYNRRTKRSLTSITAFVEKLRRARDPDFEFSVLSGFRWWWAFCKKHSVVSLYYDSSTQQTQSDSERSVV